MIKTRFWAPIVIVTVLIGGLLLVMPTESADAKPAKRAFGFGGSTIGGFGPPGDIEMAGDGDWTKGTTKIKAKGIFRTTDGAGMTIATGTWKAKTLTDVGLTGTCPPCDLIKKTSPMDVVFTAEFKPTGGGAKFNADVIVASSDISGAFAGDQTFWVQPVTTGGFGTAISLFFDK